MVPKRVLDEAWTEEEVPHDKLTEHFLAEAGRWCGRKQEKVPPRWEEFLADLKPDDKVCYYCSPPVTWEVLAGRCGYMIVRDGKFHSDYCVALN